MHTASVFVNIAAELISKALSSVSVKLQFSSGESLTLYTSYFAAFNTTFPTRYHTIILVI